MRNKPDFLAIWLGLSRIGVRVALLNTHLRDRSLAHCIAVAAPRLVIVEVELAAALETALPHLPSPPALVWQGEGAQATLAEAASGFDGAPLADGEGPTLECS